MEVKEYIVEEADKLFCQYGFKSVTMDDIAKHLGISKKTIYQHFSDKNELVNLLIEMKWTLFPETVMEMVPNQHHQTDTANSSHF